MSSDDKADRLEGVDGVTADMECVSEVNLVKALTIDRNTTGYDLTGELQILAVALSML